ncbi:MAG: non-canonical purine NTP diphosphatase [Bacteroides sp.]
MNKFVFATNNQHKLEEVSAILGNKIELLSLKDINCEVDIPETANSLEGNAYLKASYIYNNYHLNCFADDTGLEIEALNNEPGVFSARYAGENKSSEANMLKVLSNLKSKTNRKAQFRTIVSLIISGKEYRFEGIIKGEIIKEKHGNSGFGYDPIFMPDGYNKTFAELGEDIKNKISHRAIAINKLCEFLKTI